MWSLESRRDPVHQAALAFFLLAGISVAGLAVKGLAHAGGSLTWAALVSLLGVLAWRRKLGALVIGTAFFALAFVGCIVGSLGHDHYASLYLFGAVWHGALLFVMARGLVALWKS